jgi:hypothetical protein
VKLGREKLKPIVVHLVDKLKADISVADGEVSLDCACILGLVCRGPWDPCLRLINWVAIKFTHRGLGSELLPAPEHEVPCFDGILTVF